MIMKKILVATDFSPTSARALDCARTLADALGASLHLVHVIGYPLTTPMTVHGEQLEACARLETLLVPEDHGKRQVTWSCEVGTPAAEIARVAAQEGADLIVMGTHTHGPTFRMITGSIAEAVIGMAPCAVLTVKEPEAKVVAACA